jgi:hypothetical protein
MLKSTCSTSEARVEAPAASLVTNGCPTVAVSMQRGQRCSYEWMATMTDSASEETMLNGSPFITSPSGPC